MKFSDIVNQASALLESAGRITYRALKREFDLDDGALEDLREELIIARQIARDENDKILVWVGSSESHSLVPPSSSLAPAGSIERASPAADRRQLTVMFCDLVGSTPMSAQLDPEDYREIMQAYQAMCGQVLARFTGHITRYEGDGILVYFGYPQAQEDAAAQAVRAGLQIIAGLPSLNARFQPRFPLLQERPLQVRIGLHTGLVVVGEMGSEQYRIDIAVGETPNMAARVQGQAGPDEILISTATYKLIEGLFACEELEPRALKGIATPQSVYRVTAEGEAQSRFEVALQKGLTSFVGREEELGLLRRRWERARAGEGQVVLLSGEPGIGKSRLVQELKAQTAADSLVTVECRCAACLQNSALAPLIGHIERLLHCERTDSPETKRHKLERTLTRYDFALADTVSLLAALLSLPLPDTYAPLHISPQKQKAQTLDPMVTWLRKEAAQQPVRMAFEDLHWADPSTVEFLTVLVEQIPTMRALLVLTFRPEFIPPWPSRAHIVSLHLDRLAQPQSIALAEQVAGKALPAEVMASVVAKTDGIPLFVEELTKTVIESGQLQEAESRFELTSSLQHLAIPTTLQDSLRARLDRLNTAQEVAQVGATIGREFSYALVQAVSALEEAVLQQGLRQLVAADLVFQKGVPPQAQYVFKHALVQDAAYQSLLRSKRQEYHQQIAQVLEEGFAETAETQPELMARHYTEAGLAEQALPYWQRAGQRAAQRSAYVEAVSHLTRGLEVLQTLPNTSERTQHELTLQTTLGTTLIVTKSYAAPEVKQAYARALELCRQVGETPQLFPALFGLWRFHFLRGELQTARELAEQVFRLAQNIQDPALLVWPHAALGLTLCHLGELPAALTHLEQGISLYDPQTHRPDRSQVSGQDPQVTCLSYAARILWHLGYPNQARKRIDEALALAQELSHPFSVAFALNSTATLAQLLRDVPAVHERTAAIVTLAREHGFPFWLVWGAIRQGWVLAEQGQGKEGITQMRQGLAAMQATGAELNRSYGLAWLATAYGKVGKIEEGLTVLVEGLEIAHKNNDRDYEAELYRLKGELLLDAERQTAAEAERCFHKALEVAHRQEAKSLELRAATSLARLWQQQGKTTEARDLLAPVYNWFTEGFDTKDLQDAKTLLEELS